ncbi:MAG TPA: methenyltetrahydromethanopterin cyclohydrolase [Candidatus Krumholzibacteriaceae bacterium]|jgi:methenyltetrahydromethanopterin cyclohydrolase|nr:methenyltetrahydromethanopterin cyclohydrolase [Candidatus Krumholzibacteriaceae bacterium]
MLSVNRAAYKLVEKLCDNADEYGVITSKTRSGATIIDAGIQAKGSFSAGRIITEICMGGYGKAKILPKQYSDLELLTIFVQTDHPAIAILGSQFAGWQVKSDDFFALGSGPARALALRPKEIFDEIGYKDKADTAVIVLEAGKKPPEELVEKLASECRVKPSKFSIILTPTTSISGCVQISGRVIETGIHKLTKLGLDANVIDYAWGSAPVAPVHPKFADAMGRTNDVILYGGVVYCALRCEDDEKLRAIVDKAPSKASRQYGKPFKEIFKQANNDFYKIDSLLFAPAVLVVNNLETGTVYKAGEINVEVLKRSIGLAAQ